MSLSCLASKTLGRGTGAWVGGRLPGLSRSIASGRETPGYLFAPKLAATPVPLLAPGFGVGRGRFSPELQGDEVL